MNPRNQRGRGGIEFNEVDGHAQDLLQLHQRAKVVRNPMGDRQINVARRMGAILRHRPEEPDVGGAEAGAEQLRRRGESSTQLGCARSGLGPALLRPATERCGSDGRSYSHQNIVGACIAQRNYPWQRIGNLNGMAGGTRGQRTPASGRPASAQRAQNATMGA